MSSSPNIPAHLLSEITAYATEHGFNLDQAVTALLTKGLGRKTIADVFPEAVTDADLVDLIFGDGDGGEHVEYQHGDVEGDIGTHLVRGHWLLTQTTVTGGESQDTYLVCRDRAEAESLYRGAIEELHGEGVTWQPDTCPIFDEIEAGWK